MRHVTEPHVDCMFFAFMLFAIYVPGSCNPVAMFDETFGTSGTLTRTTTVFGDWDMRRMKRAQKIEAEIQRKVELLRLSSEEREKIVENMRVSIQDVIEDHKLDGHQGTKPDKPYYDVDAILQAIPSGLARYGDYDAARCPPLLPLREMDGIVGACSSEPCSDQLGPTDCLNSTCVCKKGFCKVERPPSGATYICVAHTSLEDIYDEKYMCWQDEDCNQNKDGTVRKVSSQYCYGKAQLELEITRCMCKFGYYYDASIDDCVRGKDAVELKPEKDVPEIYVEPPISKPIPEVPPPVDDWGQGYAIPLNIIMSSPWIAVAVAAVSAVIGGFLPMRQKFNGLVEEDNANKYQLLG